MHRSLPPNIFQEPPLPPEESESAWVKVLRLLFFLGAIGVVGWGGYAYYHNVWRLRLPQEHTFLGPDGAEIRGRLMGRAGEVIHWVSLADGVTHFSPLSSFTENDRAYLRSFDSNFALLYPLSFSLINDDGRPLAIQLTGRGEFFIRYNLAADGSTHNVAITELSPVDQELVSYLPQNLKFHYPFDYTFIDQDGQAVKATILGRSPSRFRFVTSEDGAPENYSLANLPADTAEFIRQLPLSLADEYPLEFTLVISPDESRTVRLEGRTNELIKYTRLLDHFTYYHPIGALSADDQAFVRNLPSNLGLRYPLECTLIRDNGQPMPVRLEGRSLQFVKYTLMADGTAHEVPLSSLHSSERAFILFLPVTYLSPPGIVAAMRPSEPLKPRPPPVVESGIVKNTRERFLQQDAQVVALNTKLNNPSLPPSQREVLLSSLKRAQDDLSNALNRLAEEDHRPLQSYLTARYAYLQDDCTDLQLRLDTLNLSATDAENYRTLLARETDEGEALMRQLNVLALQMKTGSARARTGMPASRSSKTPQKGNSMRLNPNL